LTREAPQEPFVAQSRHFAITFSLASTSAGNREGHAVWFNLFV